MPIFLKLTQTDLKPVTVCLDGCQFEEVLEYLPLPLDLARSFVEGVRDWSQKNQLGLHLNPATALRDYPARFYIRQNQPLSLSFAKALSIDPNSVAMPVTIITPPQNTRGVSLHANNDNAGVPAMRDIVRVFQSVSQIETTIQNKAFDLHTPNVSSYTRTWQISCAKSVLTLQTSIKEKFKPAAPQRHGC